MDSYIVQATKILGGPSEEISFASFCNTNTIIQNVMNQDQYKLLRDKVKRQQAHELTLITI